MLNSTLDKVVPSLDFANHPSIKIEDNALRAITQKEGRLRTCNIQETDLPVTTSDMIENFCTESRFDCAEDMTVTLDAYIKRQIDGSQGDLRTDGYANLFFFQDTPDSIRCIHVAWNSNLEAWHISLSSFDKVITWHIPRFIFHCIH